jgi:hypothetical protein
VTSPPDPDARAGDAATTGADDPVLARRAQIASLIKAAQRIGYTLFALFMVLIIIGFLTTFPSWVTLAAKLCLIVGSVFLAPAMFFTYAVKAAEREDRDGDWR